jgi:hypothetical protein
MKVRKGVANAVFAGTVVVLVIVAGVGFSLYFSRSTVAQTMTENMTETMTETMTPTSTQMAAGTAVQFTPATGQMVHTAWLVIEPTESGQYALSVYAQGLESTQSTGSDYIVEGTQSSGAMAVVPVGPNATASEFETSSTGTGSFFTLLNQNPYTSFENVQLVFLPGMEMTNATVVATATLTMTTH